MASKTPLQTVNEQHGGKEKLVDTLVDKLDRGDEDKADFRKRLLAASNSKLLRLLDVATELKERFGGKSKLVESLLGLMNRTKDKDYREKLVKLSPVRLVAMYRDWDKKVRKASKTVA